MWCVSFPYQTVPRVSLLLFAVPKSMHISGARRTSVKQVCWLPTLSGWEEPGFDAAWWLRETADAASNSCETAQLGAAHRLVLPSESTLLFAIGKQ